MNRKTVRCPACALLFTSARAQTYCPGCHTLVQPKAE